MFRILGSEEKEIVKEKEHGKESEESERFGETFTLVMLCMILFSVTASALSHYRFRFIHESGIAIMCGVLLSAILYYGYHTTLTLHVEQFLYFFLPPIIFAEGK